MEKSFCSKNKIKIILFSFLLLSVAIQSSTISSEKNEKTEISQEGLICRACKGIFDYIANSNHYIQKKFGGFIAAEICVWEKMYDREVCQGGVDAMVPSVIDSVNYGLFSGDTVCPKFYLCPEEYKKISIPDLVKDILKDKPKNIDTPSPLKKNILKVLHISDVHTDIEYLEGSNASCSYPVCCREESKGGSGANKAGKWGTLSNCDLPTKTVEQFVNFVNKNLKVDFAVWTGDNTSHDIWHQSYDRNLENSKMLTEMFKEKFDFPFFPVIGNHESFPVNVYDFLSSRESYFDTTLAEMWKFWIGEEASQSFKKNAFYTTYFEKYNLKIIGINSQACNNMNWYLLKDPSDPGDMLKWMRGELYKAEELKQNVYILTHYSPNACLDSWAKVYNALIDRFSHIIKGQFAGHTHGDNVQAHRDSFTGKVNNIVFMPASLTTYENRNPSFRVYDVDQDTMQVVEYYEYRLDLNKWNNLPDEIIEWDLAYTFSKEYNVTNASYEGYEELLVKLQNDEKTVRKFAHNESSGVRGVSLADKDRKLGWKSWKNKLLDSRKKVLVNGVNIGYYCDTLVDPTEQNRCHGGTGVASLPDKLLNYLRGDWREKINIQANESDVISNLKNSSIDQEIILDEQIKMFKSLIQ